MKKIAGFFFEKRICTRLTWKAKLLLLLLIVALTIVFVKNIVPFLSLEKTIVSNVFVLEGYVEDWAYPFIIQKINELNPDFILTTGISLDQGFYLNGVPSTAYLVGHSLRKLGIDSARVHIVPTKPGVKVNRTYYSAIAARKYLDQHFTGISSVNLISTSVHARRSHLIFKKVFNDKYELGNIVVPSIYFNRSNWYKTSRGFRTVLSETLAWLYVRLFFFPNVEEDLSSSNKSL
ncbi:MAG TPA: hypothetical protein P5104_07160 [Bacteroidales bacterium]|nr:hypothetical protein [Bacteroidales bacterium]